jgi:menaquinone-specific isochorismate synthase
VPKTGITPPPNPSTGDFAFLRVPGVGFCIGRGPFAMMASPPPDDLPCFYANDFELADPAPWKCPTDFWIASDLASLTDTISGDAPDIGWDPPGQHQWESLCSELRRGLDAGRFLKIVPVVTEVGRLLGGGLDALARALPGLPPIYWSYAYRVADRGLVGATPERLFSLHDGFLETMALAGTAPIERAEPFATNPKEIREHELVADYLMATLADLGEVERHPREILPLGSLVHFRSDLRVALHGQPPSVDDLITRLHPTPALGVLPRDSGNLRLLADCRRRLGTPRRFGAPFGVRLGKAFHGVVGIRHICWRGDEVLLPSGCGFIAESDPAREWRELALKRESVKRMFGV